MGIRFLCPAGHKLHVKAFLAGKRAVCPKCGAKVVVPLESLSPELLASAMGAETGVMPDSGATTTVSPTAANISRAVVASPSPPAPAGASRASADAAQQEPVDLLTENPAALWYMHHPSMGPFGPATADVFRSWLNEGRVSADSLVWRGGWAEWRSAAATFPQYVRAGQTVAITAAPPVTAVPFAPVASAAGTTPVASPIIAPVVAVPTFATTPIAGSALPVGQVVAVGSTHGGFAGRYAGGYSVETGEDGASGSRRRLRKSHDTMMIASGILLSLILVLAVVLAVVLSQQSKLSQEPDSPRHRARASAPPATPVKSKDEPQHKENNGDAGSISRTTNSPTSQKPASPNDKTPE